ncbi:MAG: transporter permease [Nocardioides sp.]|jgi:cell division transport system permease protein|nr:transporter permease [Nocardioides sp.]
MQLRHSFTELRQGLRRNVSMHIAVVLTLFVSLTLVGFGALLNQQAAAAADQWGSELQITVYLCRDGDDNPSCDAEVTEPQKQAIQDVVEDSPEVDTWYLESKEEAFEKVKDLYGDERFEGPDAALTADDMAESIWITLEDPHEYQGITSQVIGLPGVAGVQDLREVVGPILSTIDRIKIASWAIAGFLVLAALLLVANTIRLAALARRKEIGIMRLVGASTLYIALPFLMEALVTAFLGVALAAGALAALVKYGIIDDLSNELEFIPWIAWPEYGVAVVVIGILGPVLTVLPTLLLTRKYIKV